jgi:inosine triphosphate pyrophosphatase
MKRLCFVTGNANKLREMKAAIGDRGVELWSQAVDLDELQGTAEQIARHKCAAAAKLVDGPVMVEDTGLEFTALGGMPGPYIKWFLESVGPEGLHRMLAGWDDKSAEATCTLAVCMGPGQPVTVLQGRVRGTIVLPRALPGGQVFGWDPVFEPSEGPHKGTLTFAEMTPEQKHLVSHRGRAVAKLIEWLDKL